MNVISTHQIDLTLNQFNSASDKDIKKMMRKFQKKQEPLLVYTAAVARREELRDAEYELFMNMVLIFWKLTSDVNPQQRMITLEQLDEADNTLIHELESNDESEDLLVNKAGEKVTVMEAYHQPALVDFLVEQIIENEDEEVREETKGMLFLYLNNILDLLLQASKST